jgi:hypothetical protein
MGAQFEHFIYSQLINSAYAQDTKIEISFFGTRGGVDVDFIVRLRGQIWAIEVKVGDIDQADLTGLTRFHQYYPEITRLVAVSPKETKREMNQILICGWKELLQEMGL